MRAASSLLEKGRGECTLPCVADSDSPHPFLGGVGCIPACRAMTIRRAVSAAAPAAGPSSNRRAIGSTRVFPGGGSRRDWALPSQPSDSCAASRQSPNRPLHRSFSRTSGCSTGDPLRCASGYACLSRRIGSRRSTLAKGKWIRNFGPRCRQVPSAKPEQFQRDRQSPKTRSGSHSRAEPEVRIRSRANGQTRSCQA